MELGKCKSCNDLIDMSKAKDHPEYDSLQVYNGMLNNSLCYECYCEACLDQLPKMTDSNVPGRGENLTMRQKLGQRNTDGG